MDPNSLRAGAVPICEPTLASDLSRSPDQSVSQTASRQCDACRSGTHSYFRTKSTQGEFNASPNGQPSAFRWLFLHSHVGVGIAGGEGVAVGEDHGFGAVVAEGGFVVTADDGEGVEDVGGVVFGEAVEVEVEGVEAGAQVAAFFFVPDEGGAVVAEVAGEGGHVVGGVGEAEDVMADDGAGGGSTEGAVVIGGGDDGELLDDVPSHVSTLHLLSNNVVK